MPLSIASSQGEILLDDFGERIGELCRNDIHQFSENPGKQAIYIHPGPAEYHFDVIVPWYVAGHEQGIFFVSFKPDVISRVLRDSEVHGHELILIRQDTDDLIEVTSRGSRDELDRPIHLAKDELERVGYSAPIPGTRWRLLNIYDRDLFSANRIHSGVQVAVALSGFILMSALLVFLLRREEQRRSGVELALRDAKNVADQANEAKTVFLSNISHELRTPLTTLVGFSERLLNPELSEEQKNRIPPIRVKNAQHLLQLINDVLDMSKIESGNFRIIAAN